MDVDLLQRMARLMQAAAIVLRQAHDACTARVHSLGLVAADLGEKKVVPSYDRVLLQLAAMLKVRCTSRHGLLTAHSDRRGRRTPVHVL